MKPAPEQGAAVGAAAPACAPPDEAQRKRTSPEAARRPEKKGGKGKSNEGEPAPATRRAPFVVNSPPLPPTPESPAKPSWWIDEEDDERAAELLYTLFSGDTGAALLRDIDEWVVRDTSVAAEAFPAVPFWRALVVTFKRPHQLVLPMQMSITRLHWAQEKHIVREASS